MPGEPLPLVHAPPLRLARFRYVADFALGISPNRWALSLDGEGYDFPIPTGEFVSMFVGEAAKRDPSIRDEFAAALTNGDCAAIRARQARRRRSGM